MNIYKKLTEKDSVYECSYYLKKNFDKTLEEWPVHYSNIVDKKGNVINK